RHVQEIRRLRSHIDRAAALQDKCFVDGQVPHNGSGAANRVSANVSKLTGSGNQKGSRVEPLCGRRIGNLDRQPRRVSPKTAVASSSNIGIAPEYASRQRTTRIDGPTAVELPISEQHFQKGAFGKERFVRSKG